MSFAERMQAQRRILVRVALNMDASVSDVLPVVAVIFAQLFPNAESLS